jgi:hypothetical protein
MEISLCTERTIRQIKASMESVKERNELLPFSVNGCVFTLSFVDLLLERGYDSTFLGSEVYRQCDAVAG